MVSAMAFDSMLVCLTKMAMWMQSSMTRLRMVDQITVVMTGRLKKSTVCSMRCAERVVNKVIGRGCVIVLSAFRIRKNDLSSDSTHV